MFWTMIAFYRTFCWYTNPVEVACEFFRNVGFASRWQAHGHNESGTVCHANCQNTENKNISVNISFSVYRRKDSEYSVSFSVGMNNL